MNYEDIEKLSIILAKDKDLNISYPNVNNKKERPFLVWDKNDVKKILYLLPFSTQPSKDVVSILEMPDSYLKLTMDGPNKVDLSKISTNKIKYYQPIISDKSVKVIKEKKNSLKLIWF